MTKEQKGKFDHLKVGDPVWVRYPGDRRGSFDTLKSGTIDKVGSKYIHVADNKYHKDSGVYVSNYTSGIKLYLSEEEYFEERKLHQLSDKLKKVFGGYGVLPFSLQQLEAIEAIISQD